MSTDFTRDQTINAIQDWLKFGMDSHNMLTSHTGYFAPGGFAFDCLRALLDELRIVPDATLAGKMGIESRVDPGGHTRGARITDKIRAAEAVDDDDGKK